eukprot:TRINITY_DN29962_c0_g1_i1.p1 TRINITY_DN29962_c0_g1~~TRINITY_DN29962_c0_g1_i1.p1  ORF type:complete len:270 (-),score=58.93 TRINITY_DN29962_c0_g1_i1:182-991(-)
MCIRDRDDATAPPRSQTPGVRERVAALEASSSETSPSQQRRRHSASPGIRQRMAALHQAEQPSGSVQRGVAPSVGVKARVAEIAGQELKVNASAYHAPARSASPSAGIRERMAAIEADGERVVVPRENVRPATASPGIRERMAAMEEAKQRDANASANAAQEKALQLSRELSGGGLDARKDALAASAQEDNARAAARSGQQASVIKARSGSTDIHAVGKELEAQGLLSALSNGGGDCGFAEEFEPQRRSRDPHCEGFVPIGGVKVMMED